MTGTSPPAPIIVKARTQEFPSTLTSAELRVSTRSVGLGLCGIPYCLTQFLHHTVWHSALKLSSHCRPGLAAIFSYNGIRKLVACLGNFVVAPWYVGAEAVAPNFGDDDCELSLASTLPH